MGERSMQAWSPNKGRFRCEYVPHSYSVRQNSWRRDISSVMWIVSNSWASWGLFNFQTFRSCLMRESGFISPASSSLWASHFCSREDPEWEMRQILLKWAMAGNKVEQECHKNKVLISLCRISYLEYLCGHLLFGLGALSTKLLCWHASTLTESKPPRTFEVIFYFWSIICS